MDLLTRFHYNSYKKFSEENIIPSPYIVKQIGELIGFATEGDIIVVYSLNELGNTKDKILYALKRIFEHSIYLYVHDNPSVSTAKLVKAESSKDEFTTDSRLKSKIAFAKNLFDQIPDELTHYGIPNEFKTLFWKYEMGEIKCGEAYSTLGISNTYFYKLCDIYEQTFDYYHSIHSICKNSEFSIYAKPKKHTKDYDFITNKIIEYQEKGLTYGFLYDIENHYNICWYDIWRTLLAFSKSRDYYYFLKNNPDIKNSRIADEIKHCLSKLAEDPFYFDTNMYMPLARYEGKKLNFITKME